MSERPMLERVWSAKQTQSWLVAARVGEGAVYHVGHLARDRVQDPELGYLANALFRLSTGVERIVRADTERRRPCAGALALTQSQRPRESGCFVNEYRVTVLRRCEAQELARAFFRKAPAKRKARA